MGEIDLAMVERAHAAFSCRDTDALLEVMYPEVVIEPLVARLVASRDRDAAVAAAPA